MSKKKKEQNQKPNPNLVMKRLLQAIQTNERADRIIYEMLKDAVVNVGPVEIAVWPHFNNLLQEYKGAWTLLVSDKGREYLKNQLDNVLNYIAHLLLVEQQQSDDRLPDSETN